MQKCRIERCAAPTDPSGREIAESLVPLLGAACESARRGAPYLPARWLAAELLGYPILKDVVWAQGEAKNHGAWHLLRDEPDAALPQGVSLVYAGRPPAAPSAVSKARLHALKQEVIVTSALGTAAA